MIIIEKLLKFRLNQIIEMFNKIFFNNSYMFKETWLDNTSLHSGYLESVYSF